MKIQIFLSRSLKSRLEGREWLLLFGHFALKEFRALVLVGSIFGFLCMSMIGCGKGQDAKQTAETFTLNEADVLLAQPADVVNKEAVGEPQANIVVNEEAASLADAVLTESVVVESSSVSDMPDEKMIQQALRNEGLYSGTVDGKVGYKTKEAIREFQRKNGLNADGKVGPKTWAVLKRALE